MALFVALIMESTPISNIRNNNEYNTTKHLIEQGEDSKQDSNLQLICDNQIKEEIEQLITIDMELPIYTNGSFKTYMGYKAITNSNSKQWELQQLAYTNEDGFRMIDEKYLVAMGTYYAQSCGEEFLITLDSGKTIHVMTGDIKQDVHTDNNNQYVIANGNIIEFIMDTSIMSSTSKKMGDVSYSGLEGSIVSIEKILKD